MCDHPNIDVRAKFYRLTEQDPEGDPIAFVCEMRAVCVDCEAPFGWRGVPVGSSLERPMVSPDALELRAPMLSPSDLELRGPLAGFDLPRPEGELVEAEAVLLPHAREAADQVITAAWSIVRSGRSIHPQLALAVSILQRSIEAQESEAARVRRNRSDNDEGKKNP